MDSIQILFVSTPSGKFINVNTVGDIPADIAICAYADIIRAATKEIAALTCDLKLKEQES